MIVLYCSFWVTAVQMRQVDNPKLQLLSALDGDANKTLRKNRSELKYALLKDII